MATNPRAGRPAKGGGETLFGTEPDRTPGTVAAKTVFGYVVDSTARVLFLKVRGPLDIEETLVAMPFSQLKHVAGQLVMQEGSAEGTGKLLIVPKE
jgi:hypothetical protein